MKALFSPAVAILNRMRYPAKFALLGVIALFVVGFLLAQLALSLRASIDFTEHELDSIRRVPKVLKVVELTQQHRGLSSGVLNGNEELRPRLQKKTEELVVAMKAADEAIVADAAPTAHRRWSEVRSGWKRCAAVACRWPRGTTCRPIPGSSAPLSWPSMILATMAI